MTYFVNEAKLDEINAREITALVTALQRDLKKLTMLIEDDAAMGACEIASDMLIEARQRILALLGAILYEKPKRK